MSGEKKDRSNVTGVDKNNHETRTRSSLGPYPNSSLELMLSLIHI